MKYFSLFLCFLLISSACTKEKIILDKDDEFSDPNWLRIEIPREKEAHSIYGNIDDILIVSTHMYIFRTTDQGKTWQKTRSPHQFIHGFLAKQDTVFSLWTSHTKDEAGRKLASHAAEFSTDMGENWEYSDKYNVSKNRAQVFGSVYTSDQLTFKLQENFDPIDESSAYVLTSTLTVEDNGSFYPLPLPFDNQITNLHIDTQDRLYISATSAIHDSKTGMFSRREEGSPAIVYISKGKASELLK